MEEKQKILTKEMLEEFEKEKQEGKVKDLLYGERKKIESINDIVMIHKTDYIPTNNTIKSSKSSGVTEPFYLNLNGEEYRIDVPLERKTVHFCLNAEVVNHAISSFSNRKYAVIIPMNKYDMNNIEAGEPADLFSKKDVEIPKGSYILCPQKEMEFIEDKNVNLDVIGYEGETVDEYANMYISKVLGYKLENIESAHGWGNQFDNAKFREIISEYNIKYSSHTESETQKLEEARTCLHCVPKIIELMKNIDFLKDESSYKFIENEVNGYMLYGIEKIGSDIETRNMLFDELEGVTNRKFSEQERKDFCEKYKEEKLINEKKEMNSWDVKPYACRKVSRDLTSMCFENEINREKQKIIDEYKNKYEQIVRGIGENSKKDGSISELNIRQKDLILFCELTSDKWFEKLEDVIPDINEEQREIIEIINENKENLKDIERKIPSNISKDMKYFLKENNSLDLNSEQLISKVLTKGIEDKYLLNKKVQDLDSDEEKRVVNKLSDIEIENKHLYIWVNPYVEESETKDEFGITTDSVERIGIGENGISVRQITDDFDMIYEELNIGKSIDGDTVEQYMSRLGKYMNIIKNQIETGNVLDCKKIQEEYEKDKNMAISTDCMENIKKISESRKTSDIAKTTNEIKQYSKEIRSKTQEREIGE